MIYKHVLKPILFLFQPEAVHDFFTWFGSLAGRNAITRKIIGLVYDYSGKDVSMVVDGVRYRTPFVLSAGFDYNGNLTQILRYIGLGGEEIGSVTARPCAGNEKPRLTRLPKSRSILVNKGLRNDGVDKVIQRLKSLPRSDDFVIGISIARTNDALSASVEEGIKDYAYSFRRLVEEGVGDYYTINISCPNAYGGEAFCNVDLLPGLLRELAKVKTNKPVYVKMPINLPWSDFDHLLQIINPTFVRGVVIGNLNKKYEDLDVRNEAPADYRGGLSGEPCRRLSTELIRNTKSKYGNRFTIIGVGGVMSPEDANEKFDAGADLIQLISGLIFEGPGLVKKMCNGIRKE